jgi:glycosyltransferase involved in cell wall biosynthesis
MMARRCDNMTVLQLVPSLDVGGAERATVDIACALVAAGHRALVMSSGGMMVELLLHGGAEHFECAIGRKNPWIIWQNRRCLADFIKAKNVDLVHARSRAPAWSAYFATRASHVPFVTTFHDAYAGKTAAKMLYNSVMARGDRIIAISRYVARHIRAQYHVAEDRIVLIPRGIDFSVFDPAAITLERKKHFYDLHALPTNVPLLVLPARLSSTKGHELTLRALSRLGERSFLCLIIGPILRQTAYHERLVALIQKLHLKDKVRFIDRADLPAAYAVADLVLSPSQKAEGFGRVPVEAQAMGVPIIATALGGPLETVLDGETGWLVPINDAQALADTIAQALSLSPDQRRVMADRAIKHVRAHFDVKQMCAATLDLYACLLRTSSKNPSRVCR